MDELGDIGDCSTFYLIALIFYDQDEDVREDIERCVFFFSNFGLVKERLHFELIKRKLNQGRATAFDNLLRGIRGENNLKKNALCHD